MMRPVAGRGRMAFPSTSLKRNIGIIEKIVAAGEDLIYKNDDVVSVEKEVNFEVSVEGACL